MPLTRSVLTRYRWACVCWIFYASGALAYQLEGQLGYADGDSDNFDTSTWAAGLQWYFNPVDDSNAPLAEAGFLSRTSSISYGYSDLNLNTSGFPGGALIGGVPSGNVFALGITEAVASDQDRSIDGLQYRYVHPSTGWYGALATTRVRGTTKGARLALVNAEINFSGDRTAGHEFIFEAGRYFGKNWTLGLTAGRGKERTTNRTVTVIDIPGFLQPLTATLDSRGTAEIKSWQYGISGRYVGQVAGYGFAVAGLLQHIDAKARASVGLEQSVSVGRGDPVNLFTDTVRDSLPDVYRGGVSGTWYFTPAMGAGLGYELTDRDGRRDQRYLISAHWFVQSGLQIRIDWETRHLEGPQPDFQQFSLGLTGRF